ncbi:putative disease resistance protein RGA4 isoform X2 [Phragmites australis]|uniref:putative disease resistance protein RGA4 isoform X2 n=1 Tax=Phragmites australis TaxID=29695 RepID=UPI002D78AAFB|nr:putative disease resistance protein RGA4 isoform X2 [Phragmites australis]
MSFSKAIGFISGINECINLFQWVKSGISSLPFLRSSTQKQKLQEEVLHLECGLQHLRETLPAMYDLTDRAEWRSHETCVEDLLPSLKDAVYDAEDLLDEFRWYELKMKVEASASQALSVDFLNNVVQGSFNKVDTIQKRLDNLSIQLEKMGLREVAQQFDKSVRPETSSFPTEKKLFGRDKELKEMIALLGVPMNTSRPCSKRKRSSNSATMIASVSVLPIVGLGGIGKTTLVQHIVQHPQVKSHFDKIIWICVSDDFDVKRLTKEAVQSLSDKGTTTGTLDSLQRALVKEVDEKRFLFILDDMWDDALKENGQCWQRFCAPLTNVVQGSMILVTTRSSDVAKTVGTMEPFPLEGLNDDDFWNFFKLCVFGSEASQIDPEFENIGRSILPKLKCSPLAAKTLGRLLGMSLETTHWKNILNSELWEHDKDFKETDILPALRLSYIYLPYHLKRCFSFCAVYPKDYKFEKDRLAEFWVAEGYVEPQGNIPLQDIACQYFEDLVNRSFFQIYRSKYVIHDLMHDMAQLVSKDECFIIKNTSDIQRVPKNVRHLSILPNSDLKRSDLSSLDKHTKLRTLLCTKSLRSMASVVDRWFNELRCMRVISFAAVKDLPKSISNMKYLRYLNISETFESLPSEICCLYNLQILYVKKSKSDKFHASQTEGQRKQLWVCGYPGESLPTWFNPQNLPNLTSLSLSFANMGIDSTFSSLTDVAIEQCKNLPSLEQFLQPAYIPAIKNIIFGGCTSVESVPTERFKDFLLLEELKVRNCPKINSHHLLAPSLKKLVLENSGNLGDSIECRSLTILIFSCQHVTSIELQKWSLPALQKLEISDCESLTFIRESEPTSTGGAISSTGKFPLLAHLTIENCYKLETLDDQLLYFLEELKVCNCPKINSHRLLAPYLKKLELKNSGNLGDNIECRSLTILIFSSQHLASIELQKWSFPALQKLEISSCESLTFIRESEPTSTGGAISSTGKFPLLTHLTIEYCEKLETLDDQLLYFPAIESIRITACNLLSQLPTERFGSFPFLKDLEIIRCPRLNWQSGMVLPSSLQKLSLCSCGDISAWFPRCLENLTSLELLVIAFCEGIVSIPGHLWNDLGSLQELYISFCPDLRSIGGQRAIANIKKIECGVRWSK